ncbi:MAG: bifunctional DNA primase/polymerase, partial [Candidatus Nitrosocosmicus sp.]|nr:bifunctional DNA primase/polymerase [Candidatus Nitrosocosmicus sp.]
MINQSSDSDHYYYNLGFNIIPIYSKSKRPRLKTWKEWQDKAIPSEVYEKWKKDGLFYNGFAIMTGKLYRGPYKDKYLVCIDIDNKKGIEEFLSSFTERKSMQDLSQETLVVQHQDTIDKKAHIYLITDKPISKKCGISGTNKSKDKDVDIPIIEVKADSTTCMVGPSNIHENGYPYLITGTKNIKVLDEDDTSKLEYALDQIYQKYSPTKQYSSSTNASILTDDLRNIAKTLTIDDKQSLGLIPEGSRSNTLISFGRYLLNYHHDTKEIDYLRDFLFQVNQKLCVPPLSDKELDSIWNQDVCYYYRDLEDNQNDSQIKKQRDITELLDKIPDKGFVKYVIDTVKKTVKREDSLIRLILYASLSTYTKDPINLGVVAPTSEGKTYAVLEVIKFLPKQDVWMIGSMSPKVIIRDKGILVDNNNQPIEEKLNEIKKKIKDKSNDEQTKEELEEELKLLYRNSKILIDLSNKILVFLEPPHQETWNILKTILSHDSEYIEHPYVYKTENKGQEVKRIVTRGWPACIFCSARDDSDWSMWDEIKSRFFIVSPNMIKQKYLESNILIGQKKGLPALVQEQLIVSKEDLDYAEDCILILKKELLANYKNNTWIPFQYILSESLPSEKGPDVRTANRMFALLTLITKINAFNRPKLAMGNETLAVSILEDLEEVIKLVQNITGIPTYKMGFFVDIFIQLFLSKDKPLEKDGKSEDRIAVYTDELSEFYKENNGKPITTDAIMKTYLTELRNNELIDEFKSKVDGRKNGYYP